MEDLKEGTVVELVGLGRAVVVDGLAAGGAWLAFRLEDGPRAGRRINLEVSADQGAGRYYPHVVDEDGFEVNGEDFPQDVGLSCECLVGIVRK